MTQRDSSSRRVGGLLFAASAFLATAISVAGCGPARTATGPTRVVLSHAQLAALVDSLLLGDSGAQRAAADSLERLDDPRTVPLLLAGLRTPKTRFSASRWLSRLGVVAGLDSLIPALRDTSVFVRWSVATALGAHGVATAESSLVVALDDTAMPVRRAAALALGQVPDSVGFDALVAHRHDPHEEVRAAVARSLARWGTRALPYVTEMAEQDSGFAVTNAIEALGRIGSQESVSLVGVALLDGTLPARMAAAASLGKIGGPNADSLLVASAHDDPAALVRESATRALGDDNPSLVLTLATERFGKEPDAFVRAAWVDGLDRLDDAAATALLRRIAAEDTSPDVRSLARQVLSYRERPKPAPVGSSTH